MLLTQHNYDYSSEHMFGWLSAQLSALPDYDALLKITDTTELEGRAQALQKWNLFASVDDWHPGWTTQLLEKQYSDLYESLPAKDGVARASYIRDYLWLHRSMPYLRKIARKSFLQRRVEFATDQDFLIHVLTAVAAQVNLPESIQSSFLLTFGEALQAELNLTSLEAAIDKAVLLIQVNHFSSSKSVGIKQWIVLFTILEWMKICARSANLLLPEPNWSDWFPKDLVPTEFANPDKIKSLLTAQLKSGTEWVMPDMLLANFKIDELDSVEIENQAKTALCQFLNQSVYHEDLELDFLKYIYRLKMIIETAGVITSRSIPSKEEVLAVTINYDN